MVPLVSARAPRRTVRRRDFATTSHRAPQTVTRLTREFYEPRQARAPQWLWWLCGIVLIGGVWAAVASGFFAVKNIVVNDVRSEAATRRVGELVTESLAEPVWGLLPGNNLFFVRAGKIRQAVAREFVVANFSLRRHWPNVLKVSLGQNRIVAAWQNTVATFLVDEAGALVQEMGEPTPVELPLVKDTSANTSRLGDTVAEVETMQFVLQVSERWSVVLPEIQLDHFELDADSLPTIKAYAGKGWYVLVSTQADVNTQLAALSRLLQEKIKDREATLEYVDVRFGSRLYIKQKS